MRSAIRVATNIGDLTATAYPGIVIDPLGDVTLRGALSVVRKIREADATVIRLPGKVSAAICLLASLLSKGSPLLFYDVLIPPRPAGLWPLVKWRLFLALVRRATLILTVQAEPGTYAELLRLPRERFRFVGFKSNAWEDGAERRQPPPARGYVLACGRSYRDFGTFSEAMARTGLPGRILLPPKGGMDAHGAVAPGRIPDNVEVVEHDGRRSSWRQQLLGARIVVVPLRGDVIQPAGVSVYLEAMDLGRPVIVTEGPSTLGLLSTSTAGLVPPGDPDALATEIVRLWHDTALWTARVQEGLRYADAMGGVDRMSRDILAQVISVVEMEWPSGSR